MKMVRCVLSLAALASAIGLKGDITTEMPAFVSGRLNAVFCDATRDGNCALHSYTGDEIATREKDGKKVKVNLWKEQYVSKYGKDLDGKAKALRKMMLGMRYKLTLPGLRGIAFRALWKTAKDKGWERALAKSGMSSDALEAAFVCPRFVCKNALPMLLPAMSDVVPGSAAKSAADAIIEEALGAYSSIASDEMIMSVCQELVEQKMFSDPETKQPDAEMKAKAYEKLQTLLNSFRPFDDADICKDTGNFYNWAEGGIHQGQPGCHLAGSVTSRQFTAIGKGVVSQVVVKEKTGERLLKGKNGKELEFIADNKPRKDADNQLYLAKVEADRRSGEEVLTIKRPNLYVLGGLENVNRGAKGYALLAAENAKCYAGNFAHEHAGKAASDSCDLVLPKDTSCPEIATRDADGKTEANVGAIAGAREDFKKSEEKAKEAVKKQVEEAAKMKESKAVRAEEEAEGEEELGF